MAAAINLAFKAMSGPSSKPSMSHHFWVLKAAGLVATRRGPTIWHALNTTVVENVLAWRRTWRAVSQEAGMKKQDFQLCSVLLLATVAFTLALYS